MYPNLYYAFRDLLGLDWKFLRFFPSFGFCVAISFIAAALILSRELKRKESLGVLHSKEEKLIVGKPASGGELLFNFLFGFLIGFKFVGLFLADNTKFTNPQDFIFSSSGSSPAGIAVGLLFTALKWWEKNKQRLPKPEEKLVAVWPHQRVADMTILAAVFGFLGAKIFNSFENWNDFVKSPLESLVSFSGLTFYGGLICAALAIWYYAKKRGIGFWHLNDSAAPALMLAYGLGRIGCQVAGDGDWGIINSAYHTGTDQKAALNQGDQFASYVVHNNEFYLSQFGTYNVPHAAFKAPSYLPNWLFAYSYPHNVIHDGIKIPGCAEDYCSVLPLPVFPTPFYETVICLLLFAILMFYRKRFTVPGTLFGFYLLINGIERFFIEKIRVNTKYNIFGFHPTQAEIISALLIISGALLWYWLPKKRREAKLNQPGA